MACTHRTARKSTRRQPTSQLTPRNVPPQHVPQGEDSFKIVVTVPTEEDVQEAQ
jgi:hypothetical protein